MMRRLLAAIALPLVVFASIPGCKPEVGAKCRPGKSKCLDKASAVYCRNDVYTEAKCPGPLGCKKVQDELLCDQSESQEGDACVRDEQLMCSKDTKSLLKCNAGTFRREHGCDGPKGCGVVGDRIQCDETLAKVDEPCSKEGIVACSLDGKLSLRCTISKWNAVRHCRGAKACRMEDGFPICDESIAEVNDPCGGAGRLACSSDGKSELVCHGSRFMHSRDCQKGCKVAPSGNTVRCE
jgi:hypothetical protein